MEKTHSDPELQSTSSSSQNVLAMLMIIEHEVVEDKVRIAEFDDPTLNLDADAELPGTVIYFCPCMIIT